MCTMAGMSLREAARETGRSKGAILRAIQAGGLSAAKTDDGSWSIEPSELSRIYELKSGVAVQVTENERVGQGISDETAIRVTQLESEIKALQASIATERERRAEDRQRMIEMRVEHSERIIELQAERDDWREQAKRLLTLPAPAPPAPRRRWWQRGSVR